MKQFIYKRDFLLNLGIETED